MIEISKYFYCEKFEKEIKKQNCELNKIEEKQEKLLSLKGVKEICTNCIKKRGQLKLSLLKQNKPMCCGKELINDKCSICGDKNDL